MHSQEKIIPSYKALEEIVKANKVLNKKIVLTSGTFDILHIGHCEYMENAKKILGDNEHTILIVGVDSDEKVRRAKGKNRPIVKEDERIRIVAHIAHPDYVFLKPPEEERWKLIQIIQPDVLIISERTGYSEDDINELEKYCSRIECLESQATTSTTARIRDLLVSHSQVFKEMFDSLRKRIDEGFKEFENKFNSIIGGDSNE